MACDILDLRCMFVSEIVGSVTLAIVLGAIFYFISASKMRLGFDTTIAFSLPLLLLLGIAFTGFNLIYAFATIIIGLMLAWMFNKIIGNA